MIGNKLVAKGASSLTNALKEHLKSRHENKYAKEAIELNQQLSELNEKKNLNSDEKSYRENLAKRAQKIKGRTSNPKTYAKLMVLDLPMGDVELEAAARILGKKILVTFDNQKHVFGDAVAEDTVNIDLKDAHFKTSSDDSENLRNDCFYRSLRDKGVDMKGIEAKDFAQKLANEIVSNPEFRSIVADPRRKFWSDIGFYGGMGTNNSSNKPSHKPSSTVPRLSSNKNDTYKKFLSEVYNETDVKVNADLRDFDEEGMAKQLEDKDYKKFNTLKSQATENILKNVEKAMIADAMKNLAIKEKFVDQKQFENLIDLDTFEVTVSTGIHTLDIDNQKEIKYAIPVEMKSKYDAFCNTLDIRIEVIKELRSNGDIAKLKNSQKILEHIKTNFQEMILSFDHVTEDSVSSGKQNFGPDAPHVGMELKLKNTKKRCFHNIIPQYQNDGNDFNATVPGRVQNNNAGKSADKNITLTGLVMLDAKQIYSSSSTINNYLISAIDEKANTALFDSNMEMKNNFPPHNIVERLVKQN